MRQVGDRPRPARKSGPGARAGRKRHSLASLRNIFAFKRPKNRAANATRPDGIWARIETGFGVLPRRWGLVACAALFGLSGIYASVLNGGVERLSSSVYELYVPVRNAVSPQIRTIEISGAPHDKENDVRLALLAGHGDPILALDAQRARSRLEALPWVKSAQVLRLLPGAVKVRIEARRPYAIWQQAGMLSVIDSEGVVISGAREADYARLPLVVGQGANIHASKFLALLERWPGLRPRLRAAVRVADRRWNLRLLNGIDIRLPESGEASAIDELAALDESYGLFQRDITAVDLRIPDRITIRLSEEAALRRAKALKVEPEPARSKRKGADT